jgi:hypothetical protein
LTNNPLNATDPSGEFIGGLFFFVATAFIVAKHVPELRPFMAIAVAFVLSPAGGFWALGNPLAQSAVAGFAAGAVSTGNLRGAIQGAVSGALFAGIGEGLDPVSWSDPAAMANAIGAHAAVGCAMQAVSGGDCGSGALSAAFSKAVSPSLPGANSPTEEKVLGVITSAVIGGTAAELGGGKFANGASTAAFGYLFNAMSGRQLARMTVKGLAYLSQEVAQYGFELIAPEVSFESAAGVKIRVDGVYMGPDGRVLFGEAKVGDYADLTKNQKVGLPELQDGKGTFYGEHARAIAERLNVQVDANGRFNLGTNRIHGVYIGTYERSAPQTGRMQNINDVIRGRGFWPRSGDN